MTDQPITAPVAPTDPQPLQAPVEQPAPAPAPEETPAPVLEPQEPQEEPKAGFYDIVPPLINSITGKQWLGIRRRFDMDTQELGGDVTGQLILACWKKHLQETGKSEWEWLDDMTHADYLAYLGIEAEEPAEGDEADKSEA